MLFLNYWHIKSGRRQVQQRKCDNETLQEFAIIKDMHVHTQFSASQLYVRHSQKNNF